jgi:K+-transporting ATPase ATPase C chain
MKQDLLASLRAAVVALLAFTVLTGLVYPVVVWALGKPFMRDPAAFIGEDFTSPAYLWSRPSALGPFPYNAMNSTGTNLAEGNPALHDNVAKRIAALREADPTNTALVPIDLVTASASGLDPHVSPEAAYYQVARVARARHVAVDVVRAVIDDHLEGRTFGILGEPRVNVVLVNRDLDARVGSPR